MLILMGGKEEQQPRMIGIDIAHNYSSNKIETELRACTEFSSETGMNGVSNYFAYFINSISFHWLTINFKSYVPIPYFGTQILYLDTPTTH